MTTLADAPDTKTASAPDSVADTQTPDRWSDSMSELADLDLPAEIRSTPKKEVKAPVKAKAEVKTEEVKAPEKETAKTETTELDETKPIKASELRAHYDRLKAERETLRSENAKLKSEVEKRSKSVEDPEKKTLQERLTKAEERIKKAEEKERLYDYRNSEDFQNKYWKPYQTAIQRATQDLEDVTFEDAQGQTRKIEHSTILWLSGMRPAQAEQQAKTLFGELSRLVIDRVDRVRSAAMDMNAAVEDHQKTAGERFQQEQEQAVEQQRRISKVWEDERKAWPERFPNMFAPKEGDEEGNALLNKGYELVKQAFSPNGKPPEDMAKIHAEIYHKAAAFPRLALNLKRSRLRVKELEAIVAEYENAEPPAGTGKGKQAEAPSNEIDDAMTELGNLK